MTKTQKKRLEQYALSIPLFLGCNVVHSQISYTDLMPDITGGLNDTIELDFNEDDITDVYFFDERSLVNHYYYFVEHYAKKVIVNNGGVICSPDIIFPTEIEPALLGYGQLLSDDADWLIENDKMLFSIKENQFGIQLAGGRWWQDEFYYLGVKFFLNTTFHYGWIRLKTSWEESEITIDSYGYNIIPNGFIRSGQTEQNTFDFQIIQNGQQLIAITPDFMNGDNYNLQIFDSLGRVISQNEITINDVFTIDMNHLPNGIYFIVIDNGEFKRTAHVSYFN